MHECIAVSFYARIAKNAFENTDYAVGSNEHLINLCAIDKESVLYRLCGGDLADKLDVRGREGWMDGGREGGMDGEREGWRKGGREGGRKGGKEEA
jgi:hypothetical protein